MGTNSNKSPLQIQAEDMSANLLGILPSTAKLPFEGQMLTPTAIVDQLNEALADISNTATAKLAYAGAVAKKKTSSATMRKLVATVVAYARLMMPDDASGQAALGIQPKKSKAKVSAADKAASVALAQATRNGHITKVKKATTIVVGPDGQPLDGSTLPTATPAANGSAASSAAAPVSAPVAK